MNNVSLIGRLTKEPDLRYLQGSNQVVASFILAVDKGLSKSKKKEMESQGKATADFIRIVAWGTIAENIARFVGKGNRIALQGRIQTGSYEDNGKRIYTTDVVATNIDFIDWKEDSKLDENGVDEFGFDRDWNVTDEDSRIPF